MRRTLTLMVLFIVLLCGAVPVLSASAQYTYDELNRLTRAQYADGTVIHYSYDKAGNRLSTSISIIQLRPTASPLGGTMKKQASRHSRKALPHLRQHRKIVDVREIGAE